MEERRAPPWWPEGEPFPPERGRYWGSGPRRHGARPFFFILPLVFLGFFVALVAGAAWLGATFGVGPVLLALLVVALMVANAARRVAMPAGAILDAVQRVGEGDYGVRVPVRGTRQVRRLAGSFNAMVERLAAHEAQRRQLLADVSHELRTPLTVMQGQLEALLDGVHPRDDAHLATVLQETRVMARVIEDLRTLSLTEAGALPLHREPTDLRALLDEVAASFRAEAEAGGVALAVDAAGAPASLDVDPVRIRQVLGNLLANALRYTPHGGHVSIVASSVDGTTRLEVRDDGGGIAPEALPHVFERYYKSADSSGTGLGLPIARGLVVAHGGDIAALSDGVGRGTTIRVVLPATASRAS